jgi:hypothetical protein
MYLISENYKILLRDVALVVIYYKNINYFRIKIILLLKYIDMYDVDLLYDHAERPAVNKPLSYREVFLWFAVFILRRLV